MRLQKFGVTLQKFRVEVQKNQPRVQHFQRLICILLFQDFWSDGEKRKLRLTRISDDEWSRILEKNLVPLTTKKSLPVDDYRFGGLFEKSRILHIYYNKKERELVRTFLARKGN